MKNLSKALTDPSFEAASFASHDQNDNHSRFPYLNDINVGPLYRSFVDLIHTLCCANVNATQGELIMVAGSSRLTMTRYNALLQSVIK